MPNSLSNTEQQRAAFIGFKYCRYCGLRAHACDHALRLL